MDATWHARPRGSATGPTRRLRGVLFIFIYIGYNIYSPFRLSEGIINPLNTSHLINPMPSLNFLRVGLSSTELFLMQVTWPLAVHRIGDALEIRMSIAWTRGPPITIKAHASKGGIITVVMKRRGAHLDRPIAIQRARFRRFYNAYQRDNRDPPLKI